MDIAGKTEPREAIIFVDDSPLVAAASVEWLRECGFEVLEATRGREALRLLEGRPDVRLLITDINLPEMDGHVLTRTAREGRPDLRTIYVTGYDAGAVETDERTRCLTKPYLPSQLEDEVRAMLAAADLAA